ncbi:protein FANTASTIC FOUR 3 [Hevea brasiliensis]|uniref:protein FANTASTIC FOUR 3 n=1 Tax=Hevea brasiliensis TaxID=3981 RepID=UPI0025DCAA54|nr:protein FANTASTIC FOUR 3 [Hevea brasiliensis]
MATCGSLQHIFENPLQETPTILESLPSWKQIKPVKPIEQSSFNDIFDLIPHAPTLNLDKNDSLGNEYESKKSSSLDYFSNTPTNHLYTGGHKNGDSFSPRNYESLQLCTEGLGFESFDDVEYLKNDINEDWQYHEEKASITRHSTPENLSGEIRRSKQSGRAFPPPISCIGKSGKPWVSFKSYRHDGRFVLKQVRIPSQEVLHAYREDGRLKLQFVQQSDEILEDDDEVGGEENYTENDEQEENEETGK